MKKRRILALLLALAMALSGCQGAQNEEQPPEDPAVTEPGDNPAEPAFTQEDLAEAEEIVADALKRGEAANLIHTGELDSWFWRQQEWTDFARPFRTKVNAPELEASLHTEADIEAVYRGAFVPELAEHYLGQLFGGRTPAYVAGEDGEPTPNPEAATMPLSLIVWDRSVREILEWTEEKLVVELEGRYMLTGHQAVLPLTLWQVDGAWLLDESFSPREYDPAEGYYTREEIRGILEDALDRGRLAGGWIGTASFPTFARPLSDSRTNHYEVIDLAQTAKECPEAVPYLQNRETVRRCYYDAFVPWVAEDLWLETSPLYEDTDQGLAQNMSVAAMSLSMFVWNTENFTVYRNDRDAIVLICQNRYSNIMEEVSLCPLRLWRMEGKWLLDACYQNGGGTNTYWEYPVE